jgi:Uma2 family endonuclease
MITSLESLDLTKTYSYADYLTWQFTERIELLRGYIRQMAAPTPRHQKISFKLVKQIGYFFEKKPCQIYYAPFDVRLYNRSKSLLLDKDVYTVVQPDISVICDETKIDNKGCNGSPDWIIEILSPSNQQVDLKDKYELYQENGVLEYWIVFPNDNVIQQFVLKDGKYVHTGLFSPTETISPALFPDLAVDVSEVFL